MTTSALAVREAELAPMRERFGYGEEEWKVLTDDIGKGLSPVEMRYYLARAEATQLSPLTGQIHAVKRSTGLVIQVGIDGYRLIASRTGEYVGSDPAAYDTETEERPTVAKVTVYRLVGGEARAFTGVARWKEFYPGDGQQGFMWRAKPYHMLGIAAERQALRKAFPQELSGLGDDEMPEQIGRASVQPAPTAAPLAPPAPPPEPPSSTHQHREIRRLRDAGYDLVPVFEFEPSDADIAGLSAEIARQVINNGRSWERQHGPVRATVAASPPAQRAPGPPPPAPSAPAAPAPEPGPWELTAAHRGKLWAVAKERKGDGIRTLREVLTALYADGERNPEGEVSMKNIGTQAEYDLVYSVVEGDADLRFRADGTPIIVELEHGEIVWQGATPPPLDPEAIEAEEARKVAEGREL